MTYLRKTWTFITIVKKPRKTIILKYFFAYELVKILSKFAHRINLHCISLVFAFIFQSDYLELHLHILFKRPRSAPRTPPVPVCLVSACCCTLNGTLGVYLFTFLFGIPLRFQFFMMDGHV